MSYQKANGINLSLALAIWGILSALLFLGSVLVYAYTGAGKTFFLMLNVINIGLFGFAFLFRKTLSNKLLALVTTAVNGPHFVIRYSAEKVIGLSMVAVAMIFGGVMIYVAFTDVELYSSLIREDGVIEYGSSIFWFLAAAAMFIQLIQGSDCPLNNGYRRFHIILLMLFFLVCSGEEISWGQRIFELKTPDALMGFNVQNEITLHNLGSISVFSNLFFLISVTFFLLIPVVSDKNYQAGRILNYARFPIPNRFSIYIFLVTLLVWSAIGIRFGTLGFHPFSLYAENYYTQMDDELFEVMIAFSFCSFAILDTLKKVQLADHSPGLHQEPSNA